MAVSARATAEQSLLRTCGKCSQIFISESLLLIHEKRCNGQQRETEQTCKQCGDTFTRKRHLSAHEKGSCDSKLYKCILCDLTFRSSFLLTHHMNSHSSTGSDGKQYQCRECGVDIPTRCELTRHTNIHSSHKQLSGYFDLEGVDTEEKAGKEAAMKADEEIWITQRRPALPRKVIKPRSPNPTRRSQ